MAAALSDYKPVIDYSALLKRMDDMRITRLDLANAIQIDYVAFARNIKAGVPLQGKVILKILPVLLLQTSDIPVHFFTVSKSKKKKAS